MSALLLAAALLVPRAATGDRSLAAELQRFARDGELIESFHRIETAAVRERRRAFLAEHEARFAALDPRQLDRDGEVNRALLLARLAEEQARLGWRGQDAAAAAPLVPFLDAVAWLEGVDRSGAPFDAEAIAASLAAATRACDAVRDTPPEATAPWRRDPGALDFARDATRAARRFLARWSERNGAAEPLLAFWVTEPAGALLAALDAHAKWLDEQHAALKDEPGVHPLAIGRERYAAELAFEQIALSPEEMLAFGEAQLAALQAEMSAETAKWLAAPGFEWPHDLQDSAARDWRLGLELAKRDTVPVGAQRLFVQQVAEEAIAFCEAQQLVPIDPLARECWRLELSDVAIQKTLAYGFYGENFMGVGAPLPAMDHQRKQEALRSNARPTTRTVVPHELIPGHHLQGFHAQRRPERALWHSPFFVEGWAVHCEKAMDQRGFFRDPRERIGHLFWRLLRAARIVVSTRFHLREWTPAQMVDFMVANAGLERSAAQAEVDRYMTYSPLYQCAYLYGDHLIGQLQEECRRAWGADYSDLRFHGELLAQGSIPIAFARRALLGPAAASSSKASSR
ncbi:MAG: DUF885 family protein [Planctomycetes bacterium]|nr:DUF885 family protein [Planctomycetota bacterium]